MHNLLCAVAFVMALCFCVGCRQGKSSDGGVKKVLVMWNTDENDPSYQQWTEMIGDEFDRQGIDAEIFTYFGREGYSHEGEQKERIISLVHRLDSTGNRPDIILSHGDFIRWQLMLNDDSLVCSIPAVCYGLKDYDYLPFMKDILRNKNLHRRKIVDIHDSLFLTKGIDIADFLENLQPKKDTTTKSGMHRFVTLLDRKAVWIDSIVGMDIRRQFETVDTAEYLSCLDNSMDAQSYYSICQKGGKHFYIFSLRTSAGNPHVRGTTSTWVFYRQKSPLRFIQMKHDDVSRRLTEGPNLGPYYTMTAEDFLVNDSCIGGYFASAEDMITDAVTMAGRILDGENPDTIAKTYHEHGFHVNWDLMRPKGFTLDQMPDYVEVHNTTLHDRSPLFATTLYAGTALIAIVFLVISGIISVHSLRRIRSNRREMEEHARQAIRDEQLLELALEISGAIMFDERRGGRLMERLTLDTDSIETVSSFLARTDAGLHSLQFHGSIDNQPAHWYDMRMEVNKSRSGEVERTGFLINIDQMKETQKKAAEAHQILLEAQAREGFIASMNHEIRTPLHAIVGFALELCRQDVTFAEADLNTYSDHIESNAASLQKIINDILLVTLMKNANISAKMSPCSIASLLDSKQWVYANKVINRRHNTVEIQLGGDDVMVNADRQMVIAILDNLLINASNFSDEGSRIAIGWNRNADNTVEIWVRDEGIGIAPEHKEVIFDRFFKVSSFTPGCGLGLYICKTYIERMGGTISCESNSDKGTTFKVTIKQ